MERRSFTLAAVLGGAALAGFPFLAHARLQERASQPERLGDMLNLKPRRAEAQTPAAARYAAENVNFIFDRSTSAVRFDGSREVIVLVRQRAPRGDIVYVNDVGEPVLRISGLGGMTLFTPERPQGVPVAFVAVATPIRLEVSIRPGVDMARWVQSMSLRISRTVGPDSRIGIEAPTLDQGSYALLAEVLLLTEEAVARNAKRDRLRERMQRIDAIWVEVGTTPAVRVEGDHLKITIVPSKGLAGRPSSEKIARALASR